MKIIRVVIAKVIEAEVSTSFVLMDVFFSCISRFNIYICLQMLNAIRNLHSIPVDTFYAVYYFALVLHCISCKTSQTHQNRGITSGLQTFSET